MIDDYELNCPACGHNQSAGGNQAVAGGYSAHASASSMSKFIDFMSDDALYRAGVCRKEGIGMQANREEAFKFFTALAARGHLDGMYKLAEMYLEMNPPDRETAVRWLTTAAQGGHISSKLKLSELGVKTGPIFANDSPTFAGGSFEAKVRQTLPHVVVITSSYVKGDTRYTSMGSGFIIDDGYIVTNAHVVGSKYDYLTASFEPGIDSKSYELKALAVEPDYDVAILKFKGAAEQKFSSQKHLDFKVDYLEYGEEVYTIGNPLGIGISVSKGVVSCPNRESDYPRLVDEVIQTDITANHGNSGGALFSSDNRVAGMITFSPGSSEGGIAMCVPAKYIIKILNKV